MVLRRERIWLKGCLIVLLISLSFGLIHRLTTPAVSQQLELFEAVWKTVNDNFYDSEFNGVDWSAMGEQYRSRVATAESPTEKVALINQMLGSLETSHTHLYTPEEPAYYQLLGIFYPRIPDFETQLAERFPEGRLEYAGIGIVTREKAGTTFIKAIFEGSPADKAGLQVGDQILSVAGQPFHPIQSFLGKAGQPVNLQVQSTLNASSQKQVPVTPVLYDGITMFLEVMDNSIEVIEKAGKQIGYVHIWSYAGDQYQEKLEDELLYGRLSEADALVLDLRDGWGGAPLTALNLYTARGPSLTSVGRDRTRVTHHSQWKKPVVMVVNDGSRSAKEVLAYGFQQYDIGPVVGTTTAGAVTAGRAFIMPDDSLLYVAVADVYVDETVRLEGVGVTPDEVIPFPIEYAQGSDPQKERAIATALTLAQ
ncbi:peptidase s41 [Leptolyngbya sp. Heron Island J]|uniref:S41 family peptidase n=1 Tax=Leptolyngbya sp. Heron Island J TaxID=1385935 RepID=UPI0003B97C73|nr:S41 family peptidase [Leptolyngbya sp. Heron Island J]ESA36888.1 peptidase s41 [Leptolyngbya sp. Heron Island J]